MILIGFAALAASAYYLLSRGIEASRRRCEEYTSVLALLLHMRGALSSGGGRLCDIVRGFESDALENSGLLSVLRADCTGDASDGARGGFFRDNLSRVRFRMDPEDSQRLLDYLRGYGKCYAGEERRRLDEIIECFRAREKCVADKSEKDIKAARAVFAFAFVGIFILLL